MQEGNRWRSRLGNLVVPQVPVSWLMVNELPTMSRGVGPLTCLMIEEAVLPGILEGRQLIHGGGENWHDVPGYLR